MVSSKFTIARQPLSFPLTQRHALHSVVHDVEKDETYFHDAELLRDMLQRIKGSGARVWCIAGDEDELRAALKVGRELGMTRPGWQVILLGGVAVS